MKITDIKKHISLIIHRGAALLLAAVMLAVSVPFPGFAAENDFEINFVFLPQGFGYISHQNMNISTGRPAGPISSSGSKIMVYKDKLGTANSIIVGVDTHKGLDIASESLKVHDITNNHLDITGKFVIPLDTFNPMDVTEEKKANKAIPLFLQPITASPPEDFTSYINGHEGKYAVIVVETNKASEYSSHTTTINGDSTTTNQYNGDKISGSTTTTGNGSSDTETYPYNDGNALTGAVITAAYPHNAGFTSGDTQNYTTQATTIKATATSDDYVFDHWEKNGVSIGGAATMEVQCNGTIDAYVAVFEPKNENTKGVHVSIYDDASGSKGFVSGDKNYEGVETSTVISARPNATWYFDHWGLKRGDDGEETVFSYKQELSVPVTNHKDQYIAHMTKTPDGVFAESGDTNAGFVSGGGPRIVNDVEQTSYTIAAYPRPGFVFKRWMLNNVEVSRDNPYTARVREGRDVYEAQFSRMWGIETAVKLYETGTATDTDGQKVGTTTGDTDGSIDGKEVKQTTLQAYPTSDKYVFDHWEYVGKEVSTANPYTVKIERIDNGYITYTAVFKRAQNVDGVFTRVQEGQEDMGTTSGDTPRNKSGQKIDQTTITASAKEGYVFKCWKLDGEVVSKDNPYTVKVRDQRDVYIAEFEEMWGVETIVTPSGAGTTSGDTEGYVNGQEIKQTTLQAYPSSEAYVFDHWELNGNEVSVANPYTVKIDKSNGNQTYTAVFKRQEDTDGVYTEVCSGQEDWGTTSGDTPREKNGQKIEQTTLQAFPTSNEYKFDYWELNGKSISIANPYTVKVKDSVDIYIAHFKKVNEATNDPVKIRGHETGVADRLMDNKKRLFTVPAFAVGRDYILSLAERAVAQSNPGYRLPTLFTGNSSQMTRLQTALQIPEQIDAATIKNSGFEFISSEGEIIDIKTVNSTVSIESAAEAAIHKKYGDMYSASVLAVADTVVPVGFIDGKRTIVWSGTSAAKKDRLCIIQQIQDGNDRYLTPVTDENGNITFSTSDFTDSRFILIKVGYDIPAN